MGHKCRSVVLAFLAVVFPRLTPAEAAAVQPANITIEHIIVLYLENHTFDNLYGLFPGANGLGRSEAHVLQVDRGGQPYEVLPRPEINVDFAGLPAPWRWIPAFRDWRFPEGLPNAPFNIDQYVPSNELVWSPVHRFYHHQLQMNRGRMDKFVAWTDSGGLPMGYYETTKLPLYRFAKQFTLADNFFTAAFGGSFLNHLWLICACTPVWPNAPADLMAEPEFDSEGRLIGLRKDGLVTPDGYAVNTGVEGMSSPHNPRIPADHLLPPQTFPTIGDRLSEAGVSWAFYAGGWRNALAGHPDVPVPFAPVPMLNPFAYFERYGDGTPARAEHLKDASEFLADIVGGALPAVSFIKPAPAVDAHPGYSVLENAENYAATLIEAVMASRYWPSTAIIVTYDDFGGWFDHVPPPVIDRWGPGGRVPTLIISPFARKGFVDHTLYDTTSILRFIEWRFGLAPLGSRDAQANNLLNAFELPLQ
jgi:phospholipase C